MLYEKDRRYKIPKAVANVAKKALELRKKYPESRDATRETGLKRARQLANDETIPLRDLIVMNAWFARHKGNEKVDKKWKETPWKDNGYMSHLAWGGDPAREWARRIVESNKNLSKDLRVALNTGSEKLSLMSETSDSQMEFFDFEKSFSDVKSSIDKLASALEPVADLAKKMKEDDYPYPYPGAKKKKKKGDMAEDGDDEEEGDDFAKIKLENADLKKKLEDFEKKELLAEFAKLKGDDEEAATKAKDFSKEQIQALIDVERSNSNFGKTTKGKESGSTSNFAKKRQELEQKYTDFMACGLMGQAKEVKSELEALGDEE